MLEVELGILLDKDYGFYYYDKLLKDNGLINDKNVVTHDIYYTNKDLNGLSEFEMKEVCIRLRSVNNKDFVIQNNLITDIKSKKVKKLFLKLYERKLAKYGYKKVFDTIKSDHQYTKEGLNSKIQLQEIKDIGVLVYYDNKDYYEFDLDKQRKLLIDDLNKCGFNFEYDVLGLDKLRTLYYKKRMYSKNQNG